MRWFAAVLLYGLICSVKSEDDELAPFLKIIANPTILYNVGEIKAIFCNSSVQPIEWYSPDGRKIERRSSENTRIYVEKMSPQFGVPLIIQYVKISDAGNWTCKAGELSESIDMIVGEKAIMKVRNADIEGDEGKSVKMHCEAKGHPPPVVVWYRDNSVPISNDSKKYVIRNDNSLEIKKLDHTDAGAYVCKVRQKALSHYTDKTYHLYVKHKPILYNSNTQAVYTTKFKTEEVYAIFNETKNITCSAIANPPPSYHWYRRQNSYDGDEITDPETVIHSEDRTNSVLVLRVHDEDDLGEYKCSAKNIKGSESIVFHVSLGTKPDPPDYVALVSANASQFVFNVSCSTCPIVLEEGVSPDPENLTITDYFFEAVAVNKEYEPDWDNAIQVSLPVDQNDTLYAVGGLKNKTKYHVRVRSINAAGYSEWYYVPFIPETKKLAFRVAATGLLIIFAFVLTLCY